MKRAHRYGILGVGALVLAVGFNNCAQPKFTEKVVEAASSGEPVDSTTYLAKTKMVTVDDVTKIDLLVVVDNSGSMATEQANMGARFASLISKVSDFNWRVAITTTDMQCAEKVKGVCKGALVPIKGLSNRYYLDSSIDSVAAAQQYFSATVQMAEEGSGYEQGIGASYSSLIRSEDVNDPSSGFYRSDAALAIVVVSDANETGLNNKAENLTEINKPANLVKLVSEIWNGKPFIFNAIVVKSNDSACLKKAGSGNEGYGTYYEELVKLTGGIVGSVCEDDYSSQLADIGAGLRKVVKSISLDCSPVDSDANGYLDVTVKVNSMQVTDYTVSGALITFADSLPAGSSVQVNYNCLGN